LFRCRARASLTAHLGQVAWDNRSAAFRARVRLPPAASPQGGPATLILAPAAAAAASASALAARAVLEFFAPVACAVDPQRATVDGRTASGRSVAVTVRGLPVGAGPADLMVSFVPEGGDAVVCDGAACSLLQVGLHTHALMRGLQRRYSLKAMPLKGRPEKW
jgi:hypothetical protein